MLTADTAEEYVQSSLQFRVPEFSADRMAIFVAACREQGVYVKWFGIAEAEGYTSAPRHWSALPGSPDAKRTQSILDTLCDIRLPLGLTSGDCDQIVAAISSAHAASATMVSS